jgi:transposase
MEQLDYNLLFRWFVGLEMDEPVWDPTVFTKNRQRLLRGDIAQAFFDRMVGQARQQELLSDEHFTVDGTRAEPPRASPTGPRVTQCRGDVLLRRRCRRQLA